MIRTGSLLTVVALLLPVALTAQGTKSQANLVFGIAGSLTSGSDLWRVDGQSAGSSFPPDTVNLTRRISSGLGLMFYGQYFPGKTLGLTGEVFFMGTGYEDSCEQVFSGGSTGVSGACANSDGQTNGTSTVLTTVGGVARAWSRRTVSPYIKLAGGLAIVNRSSVSFAGATGLGGTVFEFLGDSNPSELSFAAVGAVGFTAQAARGGYQIRMELRDNYVAYDAATGPAPIAGQDPPTERRYRHLWSFVLGFDVVLERSRGRRY